MSLNITRFLDQVRAAETRQQREITLTINEARGLHADITKLLLAIEALRAGAAKNDTGFSGPIEFDGGNFQ